MALCDHIECEMSATIESDDDGKSMEKSESEVSRSYRQVRCGNIQL